VKHRGSWREAPKAGVVRKSATVAALVLACAGLQAASAPTSAGIRLALVPARGRVAVGDTLALELRVAGKGAGFNGYAAVVAFDTTALAFLPASPLTRQEGAAMTGPCGNTFHRFHAAGDSLVVDHVVLCAGVSLHDPGTLYQLSFLALSPGTTSVHVRRTQFYDAGRSLGPATTLDASVRVEARSPASRPVR